MSYWSAQDILLNIRVNKFAFALLLFFLCRLILDTQNNTNFYAYCFLTEINFLS